MLHQIASDIWHTQHGFTVNGVRVSSRMTVVRMKSGGLWLHSPVPLTDAVRAQLTRLGEVQYIVAPSKTHHFFVKECIAAFPQAKLFGAPGLLAKRPDLSGMTELKPVVEPDWQDDFEQIFFEGIPYANETVWFHKASGTLIMTDLCQWWQGDMPWPARLYARLTGVRHALAVPHTVRSLVRNKAAAHVSAQKILQWPVQRVIVAHNAVIEDDAHAKLQLALARFAS